MKTLPFYKEKRQEHKSIATFVTEFTLQKRSFWLSGTKESQMANIESAPKWLLVVLCTDGFVPHMFATATKARKMDEALM